MCNLCGTNCGRGGALRTHLIGEHRVDYAVYKRCFYGTSRVLADAWANSARTRSGQRVLIHTLVRRIVGDPGHRGVTRSVPHNNG
jgi:hypothetical protein